MTKQLLKMSRKATAEDESKSRWTRNLLANAEDESK